MALSLKSAVLAVSGWLSVLSLFPHEAVPDGELGVLHHLYIGGFIILFVCWVVGDDYKKREPVVTASGAIIALTFFGLWWEHYPVSGAVLSGIGVIISGIGVMRPAWSKYWPLRWRIIAVLGVLIMLDDWVSHALGLPTLLDGIFTMAYEAGLVF